MEPQDSMTILDYWRVIWRARWWILALTVLATIVAFGVGRVLPKVYTAKVTAFTISGSAMSLVTFGEGQGDRITGFLARIGAAQRSSSQPSSFGMGIPIDTLLKSRTVTEQLHEGFAQKRGAPVGSHVISITPDSSQQGLVGLVVEARDPKVAADLANYIPEFLSRFLEDMSRIGMQYQEHVYRAQLDQAAREIEAAENALMKFQSENKVLVHQAAKEAVESGATLRGNIMALELQRQILRMRFTDQHPQVLELDKQIVEQKHQYSKNLFGEAMDLPPENPTAKGPRKEFFVPAARLTPVQFAFLKLFRNFKFHEAFYVSAVEGLKRLQYEGLAFGTFRILDPAVPPSAPSKPNIQFIVTAAAASALIAGIVLAFFFEYLRRVQEQERQTRRPVSAGSKGSDGKGSGDGSGRLRIPDVEKPPPVQPGSTRPARTRGSPGAE